MVAYKQINIAGPIALVDRLEEYIEKVGTSKRAFVLNAIVSTLDDAGDDEDVLLDDHDDDDEGRLVEQKPRFITVAEAAPQAQEAARKPKCPRLHPNLWGG